MEQDSEIHKEWYICYFRSSFHSLGMNHVLNNVLGERYKNTHFMHGADLYHIFNYFEEEKVLDKQYGVDTYGQMIVQVPDWEVSLVRAKDIQKRFKEVVDNTKKKFSRKVFDILGEYQYTKKDLKATLIEVDCVIETIEWVLNQKDQDRYFLYWV